MERLIRQCRSTHAGSSTCPGCRADFDFEKQRYLTKAELDARIITSNHTKEPWTEDFGPFPKGKTLDRPMTLLSTPDYERARSCVNALAGIKDPEAFVKAADKIRSHSGFEYGDGLVEAMVYYDRARGSKDAIKYETGSIELTDKGGN